MDVINQPVQDLPCSNSIQVLGIKQPRVGPNQKEVKEKGEGDPNLNKKVFVLARSFSIYK